MPDNERARAKEGKAEENAPTEILVIDDDADFSRLIVRFLRNGGFEVTSADSGDEGIQAAMRLRPGLVICDLDMPGMNGYTVLRRLRQDPNLADTPVVFLTGNSKPEQVRAGMNLGADDYLTKPIKSEELLSAVRARLERARIGRLSQEQQVERALRMFSEVMHDLRDPLFAVLGYTNMLRQDTAPQPQPAERDSRILNRMQQALTRMQAIVEETLFLAKSRMQRLPFDPQPFDLRVLAEQVITDQAQGERLQFECVEEECRMVGDPLRLRQALENLLANALKYSEGAVLITLSRWQESYRIEIRDEGIGIPEAERARVFDPFFRASNTGDKPGHGLGLPIVKTCVDLHGGTVSFASEVGRGTTFTVELPATSSRTVRTSSGADHRTSTIAAEAPATLPPAPDGQSKLTAIIVDDDPLVRDVLRDLLTRSGEIEVIGEAGSIAQAHQWVLERAPRVVFLDINLPDGLGFELLEHLGAATSAVFVTSAEEHAVSAFDTDAVDYLLKPVSAERLQKTLDRIRQRLGRDDGTTGNRLRLSDTFLVKTMSEKKLIKVREVSSLIAYGEYSWVYWDEGKGALLRKPLKQWETELPEDQFVRVHRNAIINLAFMERVEKLPEGRLQVHLRNSDKPISVSLRLAPALNRKLKAFNP